MDMTWVLITGSLWLALAVGIAFITGRAIRVADESEATGVADSEFDRLLRCSRDEMLAASPRP
jgi:hypothetical protein